MTCLKGSGYKSSTHGACACVGDGEYLCEDGTRWFDTGSAASTVDTISAQDRARAASGDAARTWLPWVAGGLAVGVAVWLLRR